MPTFLAKIVRPTPGHPTFNIYDAEDDLLVTGVPAESTEGRLLHTAHFSNPLPPAEVYTLGHIDLATREVFVGIVPEARP